MRPVPWVSRDKNVDASGVNSWLVVKDCSYRRVFNSLSRRQFRGIDDFFNFPTFKASLKLTLKLAWFNRFDVTGQPNPQQRGGVEHRWKRTADQRKKSNLFACGSQLLCHLKG